MGDVPVVTVVQPTVSAIADASDAAEAVAKATPELTYGIEIECIMPAGPNSLFGQIVGMPTGWKGKYDGSITAPEGYRPVEIVSPILRGADGARQILAACKWLNDKGVKVNNSCGFHVHVGWPYRASDAKLQRLIHLFCKHEKAIYAATGTRRRENCRYACPVATQRAYRILAEGTTNRLPGNRYHSMNLKNLDRGGKRTVEFRAFAGTAKACKILAYVQICLGMVAKAVDPNAEIDNHDWNAVAPATPTAGSDALLGLLGVLGWGNSHSYGLINEPTAPDTTALVFELGRLAQKYDGSAIAD
jgi:hypothetical protein